VTPTEWVAIGTMVTTGVGALGLIINDRRKGRLSTHEHQLRYINDQQADINALRRDLSQLWDWAVRAIRKAGAAGVQLDPLPASPPESSSTETDQLPPPGR
jgi:hypothetical protein